MPPQAAATSSFPGSQDQLHRRAGPPHRWRPPLPLHRKRRPKGQVTAERAPRWSTQMVEEDVLLAAHLANCRRDGAVAGTRRHLSGVRLAGNTRRVENQRCKDVRIDHAPDGGESGAAAGDTRVYQM